MLLLQWLLVLSALGLYIWGKVIKVRMIRRAFKEAIESDSWWKVVRNCMYNKEDLQWLLPMLAAWLLLVLAYSL